MVKRSLVYFTLLTKTLRKQRQCHFDRIFFMITHFYTIVWLNNRPEICATRVARKIFGATFLWIEERKYSPWLLVITQ